MILTKPHYYYEDNDFQIIGTVWMDGGDYLANIEIKPVDCIGGFDIWNKTFDSPQKAKETMNEFVKKWINKVHGCIEYA